MTKRSSQAHDDGHIGRAGGSKASRRRKGGGWCGEPTKRIRCGRGQGGGERKRERERDERRAVTKLTDGMWLLMVVGVTSRPAGGCKTCGKRRLPRAEHGR